MRKVLVIILILLLASALLPMRPVAGQEDLAAAARAIYEEMSVAERVGQLFVVTFPGSDATDEAIASLILDYHISGVVLHSEHNNIGDGDRPLAQTPLAVAELANSLQSVNLLGQTAFITTTLTSEEELEPAPLPSGDGVPLFIAVRQEGDGPPSSEIQYGLTQVPSAMAIGATWQPTHAADVGEIIGRELEAIGVNMLLGPTLDVLEEPAAGARSDLGVRSFGGDPYWVGRMGQAYTAGVHEGSTGRIAVVAKHFPGQGSSDRPPGEEVSTIRKSLEQLRQVELAPFFAVTGQAPSLEATADVLLTTHTRYHGFQGNIQPTTRPLSFDPAALQQLLSLPELSPWREGGGLLMSDALGVRAVQRFYDDSSQQFPHRRVAKDALLAGNDILYLDQFAEEPADFEAQLANIRDTIAWFQENYETDPAFRARIDDAVLRILRLKLKLYDGDFSLENSLVQPIVSPALQIQGAASIMDLAQKAVTLIAPTSDELAERLPNPPGTGESIVIFTDVRETAQCSSCRRQEYIEPTALEERILTLYGPDGSEQIQTQNIRSFTFDDLQEFLDAGPERLAPPTPVPTPIAELSEPPPGSEATPVPTPIPSTAFQVQSALDDADWIIFAALDVTADVPHSGALKEFLAARLDFVRNARILVFSFNAPYYLDTTEVSKLTAYYALYSKIDVFLDTAVRTLFQETALSGAAPVDVPSVDHEVERLTRPDPDQLIELFVLRDGSPVSPPSEEPLDLVVGDTLRLQTGVIVDRNGQQVPDGTVVQFVRQDRLEGFISVIGERPTQDGIATLDLVLERRIGQFRITAAAGEAENSQLVDIVIEEDEARAVVSIPTPAPTPTATPTATATATPTVTPSPTPTATPSPTPPPLPVEPSVDISLTDFQMVLGVLAGIALTGGIGWTVGGRRGFDLSHRVRLVAWEFVGGLLAYNYVVLDLPGAASFGAVSAPTGLLITAGGGFLGLLFGLLLPKGETR